MSRSRPILFSAPMVRALLAGTKTQTRRTVRDVPAGTDAWDFDAKSGDWEPTGRAGPFEHSLREAKGYPVRCPYGVPGDALWVRETWQESDSGPELYAADYDSKEQAGVDRWRPSIFMPRQASRIDLAVVVVRIQRVQSISPADAVAEGVIDPAHGWDGNVVYPVARYAALWDEINGKRAPWASNPWVWVVEFKRHQAKAA